jgi:hypothetical protein
LGHGEDLIDQHGERNNSMLKMKKVALLVACVALCLAVLGEMAGLADARKGKTITLRETAKLNLIKNEVDFHEAVGTATGTFDGKVRLRINVETASKMIARFATRGPNGGLIGSGIANYTVSGSILRFSGTSTITGGTGNYETAHIEGVMNRLKETMTMKFEGTMST